MRHLVLFTLIFVFTSCGRPVAEPEKNKAKSVELDGELHKVYDGYKNAVLNGNGGEAAYFISSNTISYYSSVLDLVQNADSSKLILCGLLEKFTVLAIRQTVDWGRLRAMNGKDLFIYAIENGMIGKDISKSSLGEVEHKHGNLASGELLIDLNHTKKHVLFYKEDGRWRLDLIDILKENGENLNKMMGQPGLNENIRMVLFFKQVFGREPSRELWLPVKLYNK